MPDRIKKFIESLDNKSKARLKRRLEHLRADPFLRSNDVKKLKGWGKNVYRLRVGDIRIVYRLSSSEVEIIDIDYRGNVY